MKIIEWIKSIFESDLEKEIRLMQELIFTADRINESLDRTNNHLQLFINEARSIKH